MKQVIKITDIESGKELEIVKRTKKRQCVECFYVQQENFKCDNIPINICNEFIFKEVTKEEKK